MHRVPGVHRRRRRAGDTPIFALSHHEFWASRAVVPLFYAGRDLRALRAGAGDAASAPDRPRFIHGAPKRRDKLYAYWITVNYREAYGMYATATSRPCLTTSVPAVGRLFVTRKITPGSRTSLRASTVACSWATWTRSGTGTWGWVAQIPDAAARPAGGLRDRVRDPAQRANSLLIDGPTAASGLSVDFADGRASTSTRL